MPASTAPSPTDSLTVPTHAVLLRGINVGRNHRLAMAEVRRVLTAQGFAQVATYIQSGNIVLRSTLDDQTVAATVCAALERVAGFPVPTVAMGAEEFQTVLAANPFSPTEPKLEHVVLLPDPLDAQRAERLQELADSDAGGAAGAEGLAVAGRAVYLSHPDGLLASRLAARAMTLLPEGTARNLATMQVLGRMVRGLPARG